VQLAANARASARSVARVHFGLSARLGLDWLHAAIEQLPASGDWQRAAQSRLQSAALAAHLRLSASALSSHSRRLPLRAKTVSDPLLERWQQMLRDVRALAIPDFAALSVAVETLQALASGRNRAVAGLI
jgi:NAD-specific glutamate dehydrogenase